MPAGCAMRRGARNSATPRWRGALIVCFLLFSTGCGGFIHDAGANAAAGAVQAVTAPSAQQALEGLASGAASAAASSAREQVLGPVARRELDKMIDEAAPHLAAAVQGAIAPVIAKADAEEKTWRNVALGLGAGALAILLVLWFAVAELRAHRRQIATLFGPPLPLKSEYGGSSGSGGGGGANGGRTVGFRR